MTSQSLSVQSSARSSLWLRLLATDTTIAPTVLRATLAVVMFPHGAQKVLGWFGGYGWSGTMGFLTGQIGLPGPLAALVILLEFLGPLLLLAGLGPRAIGLGFVGKDRRARTDGVPDRNDTTSPWTWHWAVPTPRPNAA